MKSRATLSRLRRILRQELRNHRGQIGDLESFLGHRRGYLSRVLRIPSMTLEVLLTLLDLLAVDDSGILSAVFEKSETPEDLLRPLEEDLDDLPSAGLREAVAGLEARTVGVPEGPLRSVPLGARESAALAAELGEFLRCRPREQRRRLRTARKYRRLAFLEGYLGHLETLLHRRPELVPPLVEAVLVECLPTLDEDPGAMLAFQGRALGVLARAEVALGHVERGAWSLWRAMDSTRGWPFAQHRAEFFEIGARLLWLRHQPRRALYLLDRAQLIYFDLGLRSAVGRVLADRGAALLWHGEDRAAKRVLTQALGHLGQRMEDRRYRARALLRLARLHEDRGDAVAASSWRTQARKLVGIQGEKPLEAIWDRSPGPQPGRP